MLAPTTRDELSVHAIHEDVVPGGDDPDATRQRDGERGEEQWTERPRRERSCHLPRADAHRGSRA